MTRRPTPRAALVALGVAVLLAVPAAPAAADAPRPTNYRSTVTDVTPALPAEATIRVIGGDSLLELSLPAGHTALIADYPTSDDAEAVPYLRFDADGTVQRNALAVATTANEARYGTSSTVPDPDAAPQWETVAPDGTYAWHDHRIHWMSPTAPRAVDADGKVDLGGADGTWSVPLEVDGTATVITGELVLEPPPSRASTFALPVFSLVLIAVTIAVRDRFGRRPVGILATGVGVLAVVTAWATWDAVPADAGGSIIPVVVAAVAAAAGLTAAFAPSKAEIPAIAASSATLLGWGILRFPVITHAVLPTTLDPWLDRIVTSAAIGVGAGLACVLVRRPKPRSAPTPDGSPTASPTA